MANSEWRIRMKVERTINPVLPGSARMAGVDGLGRVLLSTHCGIAERRDVWLVVTDQAIRCVHSGQHCRRSRTGEYTKLRSISSHRARVAEGVGDTFATGRATRTAGQSEYRCSNGAMRSIGQKIAFAYPIIATQKCRTLKERITNAEWQGEMRLERKCRHSPFAIRHSPSRPYG
jgi:hypothetical protein